VRIDQTGTQKVVRSELDELDILNTQAMSSQDVLNLLRRGVFYPLNSPSLPYGNYSVLDLLQLGERERMDI